MAAHLARSGCHVTVLSSNERVRSAVEANGLQVRGPAPFSARVTLKAALDESDRPFDYVLLATQPPQVEEAVQSVAGWLAPEGRAVCFQNGLCEERVGKLVGRERVIGAVVLWGASAPAPGIAERTSLGGFTLGTLGTPGARPMELLAEQLSAVGPVRCTDNLLGVRWSKLAINCAISTLGTISGQRLGLLMRRYDARQMGIEIVSEVVRVARAEGVRLEKLAGTLDLDWLTVPQHSKASRWSLKLWLKHLLVLAAVTPHRRLRSSMLAAIERGRPPAVDFLNGEVVDRAQARGMAVPVNQAARNLVWAISRGEVQPSMELIQSLYSRTRLEAPAP